MIAEAKRFNVAPCGRRFGKTTLGVNRVIGPALEGYPVAWYSPTYKSLTEVWRDLRYTLAPVTVAVDRQQHRLDLITGGVVEMWSLENQGRSRGRKYKRIVVDEAGEIRHLEEEWNEVIRATLLDYHGDAWFFGTPKGRNYFWQLFERGKDGTNDEWMAWQMSSYHNPYIDPAELDVLKHELPERTFAQEILAAFLEDGGGVFRRVMDAATATVRDAAEDGHRYLIGVDWGKLADFTVLIVLDMTTRAVVTVDRFNQIDYHVQLGRLEALAGRFGTRHLIAEQNSIGIPLIEQLQRGGYYVEPFQTTNASKAQAIDALALAFERGEIQIPNDPVLIGELQAYEAERLPSGLLRYGAPPGQHDDCVMALALAWQGVAQPPAAMGASDPAPMPGWVQRPGAGVGLMRGGRW